MYKSIRRADRKTDHEEAVKLLNESEYGVLSTVDKSGQPYGIPLNFVYSDNRIYFHCATEGHKLSNLLECERVSFCVVGSTEVLQNKFSTNYESAIAFGIAREVFGDEKNQALLLLVKKYSPKFIAEGTEYIAKSSDATRVIRIDIDHLTGKARR